MRSILFSCVLFAMTIVSYGQKKSKAPITKDRFEGLDTLFERVLLDTKAAGFAVAVVEKNKVVYMKGFGYRDYEKKLPVTDQTLFAIGSCTKAFTTSLLGILQSENKLDFDKPVRQYLPELSFYNDGMNNSITLRDMMSHRTGLPRHDFSWYLFKNNSRDSLLKRIQFLEPSAGIREKWQYNNFMFLAQGMVAEKITGKSWEQNIGDRFFKPLGMVHSNFSIKEMGTNANAAIGYTLKNDSIIEPIDYYPINAMGPAGSINSSVSDMTSWLMTWVNGGKYNNKEIFPQKYLTEAISSQMVANAGLPSAEKPDLHFSGYGFGWSLSSYKGHYRVEHGGNIDGFSASTCFFPTDSIGIIVLTNQNASSVTAIVRNLLADRMLQLPYYDWNGDIKKTKELAKTNVAKLNTSASSTRKSGTNTSHSLKDYAGLFTHPGYGTFEVAYQNDSLFALIGKDRNWLMPYHYDIFQPYDIDKKNGKIDTANKSTLFFQFHMNEAGELDAITLKLEPTLPALRFTKTIKPSIVSATQLNKYVGNYLLAGATVKVYVKDSNTLYVLVPGQPDYELIPMGGNKFSIKVAAGYYVQFELDEANAITGLVFMQPNGNFKAKKITE